MDEFIRLVISSQWMLFLTTYVGALIFQFFISNTEFEEGIIPFLKNFFPKKKKTWYFRANVLILPIIGALLAWIFISPADCKSCLLTGLTWCGTLQSIGVKMTNKS